jgi:glycosyltransferase involved in cell wall biosynthesis
MALRLTKTSLPASPGAAETEASQKYNAENQLVLSFVSRAANHIARNDLPAYLQLFTEAGELTNPQRAYQVRKLLLERGLGSLQTVNQKRATALLLVMARGAITALEAEPAEPVLLNYAGVIMYELWALDGAKALFSAAKRLDPELPHLDRNLREIGNRARSGQHRKLVFHPVLTELSKRARRVADRAKPAEDMRLSLVMIVRDEEEMLPRTLEAIKPAVDEIIIVDTGSTDSTIEIAKSFGATVIEREWTGSFSEARNASLEAATGDWWIYLDADEVLVSEDVDKLRALTGQTWREAFFLHETNFTGDEGTGISVVHSALRMFRNRPNYRFSGRLHEQIAYHLPAYLPERMAQSSVRVNHYGYLGVVRESKDKARRNLDLLLAQQRETPAHALNPFFHYNLGSEYFASGDVAKAVDEFEIAIRKIEAEGTFWHEYVPSLIVRSVKSLRAAGRQEEALARAAEGLEHFPGFTDLVYEQGMASIALERPEQACEYLEHAIEMGDAPSRFTATVGAGTRVAGLVHRAPPRAHRDDLSLHDRVAAVGHGPRDRRRPGREGRPQAAIRGSLHARDRALRAGPCGPRRGTVPQGHREAATRLGRARGTGRVAYVPAALRRGGGRGGAGFRGRRGSGRGRPQRAVRPAADARSSGCRGGIGSRRARRPARRRARAVRQLARTPARRDRTGTAGCGPLTTRADVGVAAARPGLRELRVIAAAARAHSDRRARASRVARTDVHAARLPALGRSRVDDGLREAARCAGAGWPRERRAGQRPGSSGGHLRKPGTGARCGERNGQQAAADRWSEHGSATGSGRGMRRSIKFAESLTD